MAQKKYKKQVPQYGLGGDILNTGFNLWGDLTGMGAILDPILGNKDKPKINNEFLNKVNSMSDKVISPITQTVMPMAMNMVAPGSGALYSGLVGGANELGKTLNPEAAPIQQQQLNLDSRYIRRANGGPLINEMPDGNYGTDQIPTDAQGIPSSQSGRPTVAMTDAGEFIYNGYVFSKDLKNKDGISFADLAKKRANSYKTRLGERFDKGDKYAEEGLDRAMVALQMEQEMIRPQTPQAPQMPYNPNVDQQMIDPTQQFHLGGPMGHIHDGDFGDEPIRPYGSRTDRYGILDQFGVPVQQSIPSTTATVRGPSKNMNSFQSKGSLGNNWDTGVSTEFDPSLIAKQNDFGSDPLQRLPLRDPSIVTQTAPFIKPTTAAQLAPSSNPITTGQMVDPANAGGLNNFLTSNAGLIGGLAQAIPLAIRGNRLATQKPERVNTPDYIPQQISLANQREDLARRSQSNKATAIRNTRNNLAGQLAATTAYDEQLGSQMGQSFMNEQNANVQERNRAGMFNTQVTQMDNERTAMEKAAYSSQVDQLWQDIGSLGVGVTNDAQKRTIQAKLLRAMQSKNFNIDPETLRVMLQAIK